MANYTIELREIVENGRNIFPFAYEFYDESKRAKFERDFIRHFYFREIGVETVDRFILNLEDKMNTVFPVYNAMLKASQIEYNVLDNYYLSETTKRTVESKGKSSGVSSTVGQTFDTQQTDTTENMSGTGTGSQNETGTSETVHNGTSETIGTGKETSETSGSSVTDHSGTSETEFSEVGSSETVRKETTDTDTTNNSTVSGSSSKTGENTSTNNQTVNKKFLDTPQGLTDLTDSKYLTNLSQDNSNGTTENNSTETDTNTQTTTGTGTTDTETDVNEATDSTKSGNSETSTSDNTETVTTGNGETNTESNSKTTVSDTNTGETSRNATEETTVSQDSTGKVTYTGEQKTTADNNTRTQNDNKSTEETEIIHKGNIGVDSDAVMIQKHLKLQQLIAKTFQMFFDECEDLFMMVY